MSTEITRTHHQSVNPFQKRHGENVNQGTTQVEESRAIAQQQAQYIMAANMPRDAAKAYTQIIAACKRKGLADVAIYSLPRGGSAVTGPSIRLAEELARCWGNIDYGIVELSRGDGFSEMRAYATDLETRTTRSTTFDVRHEIHKRDGSTLIVKDPNQVYEMNANMGARRLRNMLFSIIPADVVEAAINQCKLTIKEADSVDPIADRITKMIAAFKSIGISEEKLAEKHGKPLSTLTSDQISDFILIYKGVTSGEATADEFFGAGSAEKVFQETKDAPPQPPKAVKTKGKPEAKASEPETIEGAKVVVHTPPPADEDEDF